MNEHIPFSIFENNQVFKVDDFANISSQDFEGKRVVAIVLPYHDIEEAKSQLVKIFGACGIQEGEILIINYKINWNTLQSIKSIKEVFLFGVKPNLLDIFYNVFPYKFIPIANKKLIVTDPLDLIMGKAQLKADFWHKCLKPYYLDNSK